MRVYRTWPRPNNRDTKGKLGGRYLGYGNDSRQSGPLSSQILHIARDGEFALSVKRDLDGSQDGESRPS